MQYGLLAGMADALKQGIGTYREESDKMRKFKMDEAKRAQDTEDKIQEQQYKKEILDMQKQQGLLASQKYEQDVMRDQRDYDLRRQDLNQQRALARERLNLDAADKGFQREQDTQKMGLLTDQQKLAKDRLGLDQSRIAMDQDRLAQAAAEKGLVRGEGGWQKSPTQEAGISKLGAEAKNKVGGMFSSLQSLDELETLVDEGKSKPYISSDAPLIGGLIKDDPVTVITRKLSDDVGRLRSGGAISGDEESRFLKMLPTPADYRDKNAVKFKLNQLRNELNTRIQTYGVNPDAAKGLVGSAPKAPTSPKPKSVIQNGIRYDLNPETGEYE